MAGIGDVVVWHVARMVTMQAKQLDIEPFPNVLLFLVTQVRAHALKGDGYIDAMLSSDVKQVTGKPIIELNIEAARPQRLHVLSNAFCEKFKGVITPSGPGDGQ